MLLELNNKKKILLFTHTFHVQQIFLMIAYRIESSTNQNVHEIWSVGEMVYLTLCKLQQIVFRLYASSNTM